MDVIYVAILVLWTLLARSLSGLIVTKPNGNDDVSILISHVNLLRQNISILQSTTERLQTDLTNTLAELQGTKKDLQATQAELESTKKDLQTVQADLKTSQEQQREANAEIASLLAHNASKQPDTNSTCFEVNDVRQDLQLVKADLHSVQSTLNTTTSEVSSLHRVLSDVEKHTLEIKQSLTLGSKTRNVSFHAQFRSADEDRYPPPFTNTIYNPGSGYNSSTQRFTAPASGAYMFWTQVEVYTANTHIYVYIRKSGGDNVTNYVDVAAGYVGVGSRIRLSYPSVVTVTHLDKGQEAWVEISDPQSSYHETYFGGVLI